MAVTSAHVTNPWGAVAPQEALRQVAELCHRVTSLALHLADNGFQLRPPTASSPSRSGILAVDGKLAEPDKIIRVRCKLVEAPKNLRVSSEAFFKSLAELGDRVHLTPPVEEGDNLTSLWVELRIQASPLSLTRMKVLTAELEKIHQLANILQADLPTLPGHAELAKRYRGLEEVLEPVLPWEGEAVGPGTRLGDWAQETMDYLLASTCVAVAAPYPVLVDLALAATAACGLTWGHTFGRLLLPAINAQKLVELAQKAPGPVVVPAVRLSLGSNLYELAGDCKNLLACLDAMHCPVLFIGTFEELQGVFHGGQGGVSDPLLPVLRRVPEVEIAVVARFAVAQAAPRVGGLPPDAAAALTQEVLELLADLPLAEQWRLLPLTVQRLLADWDQGRQTGRTTAAAFVARAAGLNETLGGLSAKPRVQRSPAVQERFTRVLTAPDLLPYFQEHLLAQDQALTDLTARLRMEALTRPLHQPLRYCAQGTPGTGKSESAMLLAQRLEVPYVNIDAASFPSFYTASAQLLGSGRGIVNSYQAGRLEMTARHHTGVVLEVSDLDHAPVEVRAPLADLFLQVLETGEAQAASGAMFNCTNLIICFTLNLPGGLDEQVYKGMGFVKAPSKPEVGRRVAAELKNLLSGAFLSRVGEPILFPPLTGAALAAILERALRQAILVAATRLQGPPREVVLEPDLGRVVLASLEASLTTFGARALLEHGRSLAAQAIMPLVHQGAVLQGRVLRVAVGKDGKLAITVAR